MCTDRDRPARPAAYSTAGSLGDREFLAWLARWASGAELVTSVCTGSAVLAAAGLIDGYRATSNKRPFARVCEQRPGVEWVPEAR